MEVTNLLAHQHQRHHHRRRPWVVSIDDVCVVGGGDAMKKLCVCANDFPQNLVMLEVERRRSREQLRHEYDATNFPTFGAATTTHLSTRKGKLK